MKSRESWILIVGIIIIAANMRAPLTSVGPLVASIRDTLHLSNTLAGTVTTLPLLAFALFSPFVPRLARRVGVEPLLLAGGILLTIGIIVRSLSGTITLFIGTALLGLAISVCNVLLPSLIKREFPDRLGMMTGIYSVSMNLCGAIASGISIPMAIGLGLGWQGALGVWAVLSLLSILFWLPQRNNCKTKSFRVQPGMNKNDVHTWRSPLAWQVTLFMGLQSTIFYCIITWLPDILSQKEVSPDHSGWLLSLMQLSFIPFLFIVPIMAGKMHSQRLLVTTTTIMLLVGLLGLLYGSMNLITLWVVVMGSGIGFAFSLAMMFFGLRTRTAHQAADLSGMAQSVGYLVASVGPTLLGYLHDATNSWTVPFWLLIIASLLLFLFGLGAGSNRYVDSGRNIAQTE